MLYGIEWIDVAGRSNQYTFAVISDRRSYDEQLASFDQQLWLLLGAFSVLLLGAQIAVLRWGLAPLRKLARQIRAIEGGEAARIEGPLHRELRPLGDGLNALLQHEQGQQQRYRNALDDLAHSLKTPLAVLRNLGDDAQIPEEPRKLLREHGQRMEQIVGYQLQRAATRGQRALAPPVALAPVLARLARTLEKVFAGKQIQIELEIPEEAALRIDEGDLMELCGNLMENACKYGRSHVRVSAQRNAAQLTLTIEDDGPGFPPDAQQLITRGTRADTRTDGQGIGLAVAAEIAASYTAEMRLQASEALGGASVCLRFVGASGQ
jgi:two-component system sensor histidine kinase PhoQ